MARKSEAPPSEKNQVTEVFVSREYLEKLGLLDSVLAAVKTGDFGEVYKRLVEDALEVSDTNLVKMVSGKHIISVNEGGITFESVESAKVT